MGSYADDLSIGHAVGADGFVTGNYAITYDAGDLTIDPRPITLRANDRSKITDTLTLGTTSFSLTSGSYANSESVSQLL